MSICLLMNRRMGDTPRFHACSRLISSRVYGPIESFPDSVLGAHRERALLFKTLATLRTDAPLFADVDEIEWRGPTAAFSEWPQRMADERIQARCDKAGAARNAT